MLTIKTKVAKRGELSSYINKPVLNKIETGLDFIGDVNIEHKEVPIGVITNAIELVDCYELTMQIWDKYVIKMFSFQEDNLDSMMLSIARR